MEKNILFDMYEFPVIKGLDYLTNEDVLNSDGFRKVFHRKEASK